MLYGYARVSSHDQDLAGQVEALEKYGCTIIRQEIASAGSDRFRPELELLIEFLRPDDVLAITRIDRLARSIRDLHNIVHRINERGANLQAIEQKVDTSCSAGKAFLSMLGLFAEFETNIRSERQAEGI